jgi:hypothetical protein
LVFWATAQKIIFRRIDISKNLPTYEQRPDAEPCLSAVLQLPSALYHKEPLLPPCLGFLLQQQQILDLGILGRCDNLCPHKRDARSGPGMTI